MTLHDRALRVTPGGSQTRSKAPGRVGPIGAFPLYALHGQGARLFVTNGDEHDVYPVIDWFNGNCAVTLGHGHGAVTEAVARAVRDGALLSLPSRAEIELAERLVDVLAWPEQIRFVKTGSEACAGAVRIARMATGRDVILTIPSGYHGWHDWFSVVKSYRPGIPDFYGQGVGLFEYNDLDSLDATLARHEGRVAAVMLEPTLVDEPAPGFLEGVRDRAHAAGALLILDEMICGNRWQIGGGTAHYGVTPDLATFGKAFANGLPLAFIAGRRDVMQHAWAISGTFGGETAALAACQVVLDVYTDAPVIEHLARVGAELQAATNAVCQAWKLPARMAGPACRPVLRWDVGEPVRTAYVTAFQEALAVQRVLAHPSGWNPSYAHTPGHVAATCEAVGRALASVARLRDEGTLTARRGDRRGRAKDPGMRPSLRLDALTLQDCETVRGWRNLDLSGLRTPYPLTEAMQAAFYRDVVSNRHSSHRYLALRDAESGELLAMGGLTNLQWENRIAEISLIVSPDRRHGGVGRGCADRLLRYAFDALNLQTVFGECYTCNPSAERFWLQWTAAHDGDVTYLPSRKFWDGRYWNSLYFSVSRPDVTRSLHGDEAVVPRGSSGALARDIAKAMRPTIWKDPDA